MIVLNAIRGDTATYSILVTDNAGEPYDLTGANIWFSVKHLLTKSLDAGIEVTEASEGAATITIEPEDTTAAPSHRAVYPFDVQIQFADGTVKTPLLGRFVVVPDVTI